jgi:hypothetical protein
MLFFRGIQYTKKTTTKNNRKDMELNTIIAPELITNLIGLSGKNTTIP